MGRKRKRNRNKKSNYNGVNMNTNKNYSFTNYVQCHTGNHAILSVDGHTLYAGGWSRGIKPARDSVIIDLADSFGSSGVYTEKIQDSTGGLFPSIHEIRQTYKVLHLGIKDFGIPNFSVKFWKSFSNDVFNILETGNDIYVACTGGHGRTGLVVSILSGILLEESLPDPVGWLRKQYCNNVVETYEQEEYVYGVINAIWYGGDENFTIKPRPHYDYTKYTATNKTYDTKGNEIYAPLDSIDPYETETVDPNIEDETAAYLAWLEVNRNSGG